MSLGDILAVISLISKVSKAAIEFGLDWKTALKDVKKNMSELLAFKTVLADIYANILTDEDFKKIFNSGPEKSALLAAHRGENPPTTPLLDGPGTPQDPLPLQDLPSNSEMQRMLKGLSADLEGLLKEMESKMKGKQLGWRRFTAAFMKKETIASIEEIHRKFSLYTNLLSIDTLKVAVAIHKEVRGAREEKERAAILDPGWLGAETFTTSRHVDMQDKLRAGTGTWFLESKVFKGWLEERSNTLFCPGIPGAGKTFISARVIGSLQDMAEEDPDGVGLGFVYCDYKSQGTQTTTGLLGGLLLQLLRPLPNIPKSVSQCYEKYRTKRKGAPSVEEIISLIKEAIKSYHRRVFVVIDALDELSASNPNETRETFIEKVRNIQSQDIGHFKLMVTSRFVKEIHERFAKSTLLEIHANKEDVIQYIEGRFPELPAFVRNSDKWKKTIREQIPALVNGMFLLAKLYIDSLIGRMTPDSFERTLKRFSSGSDSTAYAKAYDDAMKRIDRQSEEARTFAKNALLWVTRSKSRLSIGQLRDALAVKENERTFNSNRLADIEDVVSCCAGLLTIDHKNKLVGLAHTTAQEYFESKWKVWFPDGEKQIARVCVTYLSRDEFSIPLRLFDQKGLDQQLELIKKGESTFKLLSDLTPEEKQALLDKINKATPKFNTTPATPSHAIKRWLTTCGAYSPSAARFIYVDLSDPDFKSFLKRWNFEALRPLYSYASERWVQHWIAAGLSMRDPLFLRLISNDYFMGNLQEIFKALHYRNLPTQWRSGYSAIHYFHCADFIRDLVGGCHDRNEEIAALCRKTLAKAFSMDNKKRTPLEISSEDVKSGYRHREKHDQFKSLLYNVRNDASLGIVWPQSGTLMVPYGGRGRSRSVSSTRSGKSSSGETTMMRWEYGR